jgi:Tfp pilus assembly protein PilO
MSFSAWIKENGVILSVLAVLLIALAFVQLAFISPYTSELRSEEDRLKSRAQEMRAKGWTIDVDELRQLKTKKIQTLSTLRDRFEKSLGLAQSTLVSRIGGDTPMAVQNFMDFTGRLEFQKQFDQVRMQWQRQGISLHPEVLKLSKESEANQVYILMLQLWSLDEILRVAVQNDLRPQVTMVEVSKENDAAEGGATTENLKVADVEVLNPVGHASNKFANKDGNNVFLLEFPVRLNMRGKSEDLYAFLKEINNPEKFVFLNHIEVHKVPPEPYKDWRTNQVKVMMECSTFFNPLGDLKATPVKEEKKPVAPPPQGV